jgi:amidase
MAGLLDDHDLTGLAALVRSGDVAPIELVDEAIARIEAVDPLLNAVIHRRFERARSEAADLPDGPLRGVPFLLKDHAAEQAGEPHHQGMRAARDAGWRGEADSPLTTVFRDAGLVVLGRTNSPELAVMGTTEPAAYGPTHNPWALGRSPGGSSGGSAAAVAAGMVPAAHANDIAGSIRIPASQCGLVGLKPTRGRVVPGRAADPAVGMNTEGVITRTVRDTAILLDVATDRSAAGPWPAPPLPGPLVDELRADPGALRIGLCVEAFNGVGVDDGCVDAARGAAVLLDALGHHVEAAAPAGLFDPALLDGARVLIAVYAADEVEAWSKRLGRPLGEADLEPLTWALVESGRVVSGTEVLALLARQQELSRAVTSWWRSPANPDGFDLLLTPTTAEPGPLHGAYKAGYAPGRGSAFTRSFNVTGQPAISLPLGWPADGLPRGVQLVAGYGREDVLVRVAAQLEAAAPWADRRPPVHA